MPRIFLMIIGEIRGLLLLAKPLPSFVLRLPFLAVGVRYCRPPFAAMWTALAFFRHWNGPGTFAVSPMSTPVYIAFANGYCSPLHKKGLAHIGRPGMPGRLPYLVCQQQNT
jgi:hypothetical protein